MQPWSKGLLHARWWLTLRNFHNWLLGVQRKDWSSKREGWSRGTDTCLMFCNQYWKTWVLVEVSTCRDQSRDTGERWCHWRHPRLLPSCTGKEEEHGRVSFFLGVNGGVPGLVCPRLVHTGEAETHFWSKVDVEKRDLFEVGDSIYAAKHGNGFCADETTWNVADVGICSSYS